MKTMIKTRKMYQLAAALVIAAGLSGQLAYAGQPAVAPEIQAQGEQALKTIRGEIAASIKTPMPAAVPLPAMTVYASALDNAARQLRRDALARIRAELKASVASDIAAALGTPRPTVFATTTARPVRANNPISATR